MARNGLLPLLALLVSLAACGDDPVDPGPQELAGTYTLVSFTQPPSPSIGPPQASGTLTLTGTRYDIAVTITLTSPPTIISDEGTYTAANGQWSQTSDQAGVQSTGIYALENGTLTLSTTTEGVTLISVWQRQ